ncbi:hypothetical protein [Chamaesiphon sp.]|uniref:hypothetical protein n=1 Tax=Chamaesiphon sp. TaxID=2814140 RepID=UPI003592F978
MTAILIATIGTRDLMFQISSGLWYSIGDFTERVQVINDLGLDEKITHRDLTQYLSDRLEQYLDRIKPVIMGKLLTEQANQIEQLYLVGTNQLPTVIQRNKDTIYSCNILKAWVEKNLSIPTKILPLGEKGTDPSNFEAMFEWWRKTWREEIESAAGLEIWLGLKGGVGQTSEAGRTSGLSLYGERIKFFEFHENERNNQAGKPSDYTGPFLGTNYLWDRTQQQALGLLDRFDYAGAKELLKPYFHAKNLGDVSDLLEAGIAWNRGEFHVFSTLVSAHTLDSPHQAQSQTWWWMAYEQAYLAVVRLEQNNVAEAMLHSFRAVEGGLLEWAKVTLGDNFHDDQKDSPIVFKSILESHSSKKLREAFKNKKIDGGEIEPHVIWMLISVQREILKVSLPAALKGDFEYFWSKDCKNIRNRLSHRLGGMSAPELLQAWGEDLQDRSQWQARLLGCLNILTGQSFSTLDRASLFTSVHNRIRKAIELS